MNIFFSDIIQHSNIVLPEDESRHCIKVLRHSKGDIINCIDGKGNLYEAEIIEITKKHCIAHILSQTEQYGVFPYTVRIAVAPTKNIDRFEFFVEKAVELGVSEIIPLLCEHSERKIVKPDRLEKIILSAMKQSHKAQRPLLRDITPFSKLITEDFAGIRCIAHCETSQQRTSLTSFKRPQESTIIIGPEGDFSPDEISAALAKGWTPIHLGESRLRTETAAIAAIQSIHVLWW